MTKNLTTYTLFGIIWSVAFFIVLNWAAQDTVGRQLVLFTAMAVYGIGYYVGASHFTELDVQAKTKVKNLGFWYLLSALATSLAATGIWALWVNTSQKKMFYNLAVTYVVVIAFYVLTTYIMKQRYAKKPTAKKKK